MVTLNHLSLQVPADLTALLLVRALHAGVAPIHTEWEGAYIKAWNK